MIFKRYQKSIGILMIICILLLGMYPCKSRVDSFFSSVNSCASPVSAVTKSSISSPGSNVPTNQAYTRESILRSETVLAPKETVRRASSRLILRNLQFISLENCSLQYIFNPSVTVSHHIPDGFISNTIIVTYIHSQDGKKA